MTLIQRQPSPLPGVVDAHEMDELELAIIRSPTSPRSKETPVPYVKLLPLLIQRWSEGVTYAIIFPYINEMVHSMGVEEKSVGVWSATAESVMMVTESLCAPLYAPLADRFGRRPVLIVLEILWGLFGVAFGFSRTVWAVVILRGCLGLLAGCGVISRTMVGELCDRTNRIKGFAVFSPSFTIGMTTAPLLGGLLAKPVPRILPSSWTVLSSFPYLLPALVAGLSAIIAAWSSMLLLPETLDRAGHQEARAGRTESGNSGGSHLIALLKYKKFVHVAGLYSLDNAIMFSFEAVFPLFGFTSKELGGLGLSTQTLGIILGLSAALSIIFTIFLFPRLHSSMTESRCLFLCLSCYPVATMFFPVMWLLNYSHEGSSVPLSVWLVMSIHMVFRRIGDFASIQLDTLVFDSIPGPEYLASANSLTFSLAAVGRSVGPFIVSYFFSVSTTFSPFSLGMQIVWAVLVLISVPSLVLVYRVGEVSDDQEKGGHEHDEEHELLGDRSGEGIVDVC